MFKILALFALIFSTQLSAHHDTLVYTDYEQFFELGDVTFERSAGSFNGRTSDYHVVVHNHYNTLLCLVPTLDLIKNGRNDFIEESFILEPNSATELGSYGAENFGKSWHVKWNYFVSQNLEYCAI